MGTLADGCPVAIAGELFFDQGRVGWQARRALSDAPYRP